MKASAHFLLSALTGAALLAAMPVAAADPSMWLQRQFSTVHQDPMAAHRGVAAMPAAAARGSGHDHARSWLERQFAGAGFPPAAVIPTSGLQRLIHRPDAERPIYHAWLQRVLTTEHRDLGTRL